MFGPGACTATVSDGTERNVSQTVEQRTATDKGREVYAVRFPATEASRLSVSMGVHAFTDRAR